MFLLVARGVGLDDLQRSLPTQSIPWFYDKQTSGSARSKRRTREIPTWSDACHFPKDFWQNGCRGRCCTDYSLRLPVGNTGTSWNWTFCAPGQADVSWAIHLDRVNLPTLGVALKLGAPLGCCASVNAKQLHYNFPAFTFIASCLPAKIPIISRVFY